MKMLRKRKVYVFVLFVEGIRVYLLSPRLSRHGWAMR